jgi:hypothetical protein
VLSQENKTEAVHITNISNPKSRNLLILATVRAVFNFLEYPFQTWLYNGFKGPLMITTRLMHALGA